MNGLIAVKGVSLACSVASYSPWYPSVARCIPSLIEGIPSDDVKGSSPSAGSRSHSIRGCG